MPAYLEMTSETLAAADDNPAGCGIAACGPARRAQPANAGRGGSSWPGRPRTLTGSPNDRKRLPGRITPAGGPARTARMALVTSSDTTRTTESATSGSSGSSSPARLPLASWSAVQCRAMRTADGATASSRRLRWNSGLAPAATLPLPREPSITGHFQSKLSAARVPCMCPESPKSLHSLSCTERYQGPCAVAADWRSARDKVGAVLATMVIVFRFSLFGGEERPHNGAPANGSGLPSYQGRKRLPVTRLTPRRKQV
jgi:hypothetical protein